MNDQRKRLLKLPKRGRCLSVSVRIYQIEPAVVRPEENTTLHHHDVRNAFVLFLALHDSPTSSTAQQLIDWLQQDPERARALDRALTLWALTCVARPDDRGRLS